LPVAPIACPSNRKARACVVPADSAALVPAVPTTSPAASTRVPCKRYVPEVVTWIVGVIVSAEYNPNASVSVPSA